MAEVLSVTAVILAFTFCVLASIRIASLEQRRAKDVQFRLVSELSPFQSDSDEQKYLDWVEIGAPQNIPEIAVGKQPIHDFVTTREVDQVSPEDSLAYVYEKLHKSRYRFLAVVNGAVVGTIGSVDFKKAVDRAIVENKTVKDMLDTLKAGDIMEEQYTTAATTQTVNEVVQKMNEANRMAVVILDEQKKPYGVVARTGLAASLRKELLTLGSTPYATNGVVDSKQLAQKLWAAE
jgi:CBS domain-containing protein